MRTQTLSFEMMPPRHPENAPKFWKCAENLIEARPEFISITYGAAGNDRSTSLEVIRKLVRDTPILPIAHLTCVATHQEDLQQTVCDFLDAGVRMFLSLRGDIPKGVDIREFKQEKIETAAELTHFLRLLDKQQQRDNPQRKFKAISRPLVICVAAMPEGNQNLGTTVDEEIDKLLDKQDAGADFAITQLYYDASVYDSFVEKARKRGVVIPILAGVMPTTDPDRLVRVEETIGVPKPVELLKLLEGARDDHERHELGMNFWKQLSERAMAAGSPGIHMFTFNNSVPPLDLARRLGMLS